MTIKTQYELTTFLVRNLRNSDLTPNERYTLIVLSDRVNDKMECWPSYELLAEDTGFSVRGVKNFMKSLIEKGVISSRLNRTQGATWQHNVYTFNIAKIMEITGNKKAIENVVVTVDTVEEKKEELVAEEVKTAVVEAVKEVMMSSTTDNLTPTIEDMKREMSSVGITISPYANPTEIKTRYEEFKHTLLNCPF
ncbi:MAG: helix-turn-helix domain-containing protein [Cetobacterium sp.]